MIGLAFTAWSFVRSSRLAQYALIGAMIVGAVLLYGRSKRKQGMAEAAARSIEVVMKRMEEKREIHREISRLPLDQRARRLRALDRGQ